MAWFIVVYSVLASMSALSLALTLARRFRCRQPANFQPGSSDSVSVLVPIKGVDEQTQDVLQNLVSSNLPGDVEFIFAMESDGDPSFWVCTQLQRDNPERIIKIVISGEARDLIGKQHNLAHAFSESQGQTIVCMDAISSEECEANP